MIAHCVQSSVTLSGAVLVLIRAYPAGASSQPTPITGIMSDDRINNQDILF